MKGAKTEDGLDIRVKMWELMAPDLTGTILAEVKSGVNIHEYVAVQDGPPDMSSKRGLALKLLDGLQGKEGMDIGEKLVELGLAEKEVRERKFIPGKVPYYVVRKGLVPSSELKLLRQHEAYLAKRLKQFRMKEKNPEDSARFEIIGQRIQDFQSKLEEIQERRKNKEEEESRPGFSKV